MNLAGTGNTVVKAINVLKEHGVKEENVVLLNLFCTPQGKQKVLGKFLWKWREQNRWRVALNRGLTVVLVLYSFSGSWHRICQLCSAHVEDALHFVFGCVELLPCRHKLYQKAPELLNHSNLTNRFKVLSNMPYTMGNVIEQLWQERKEKLESR